MNFSPPLLIGLELDPAHYENGNFMSIFVMAEVGLFPGAGLIPLSALVGLSQNAEGIEDVYIIEKNDGEILVAEMAFDGIYAHIAIFMRHGKGILFGFATDISEMQPLIADAFHATLDSFEFTEINNAQ
jgi:hypothetical protein